MKQAYSLALLSVPRGAAKAGFSLALLAPYCTGSWTTGATTNRSLRRRYQPSPASGGDIRTEDQSLPKRRICIGRIGSGSGYGGMPSQSEPQPEVMLGRPELVEFGGDQEALKDLCPVQGSSIQIGLPENLALHVGVSPQAIAVKSVDEI